MIRKTLIAVLFLLSVAFLPFCQVYADPSVKVLNIVLTPQEFSSLPEFLQVRALYGQQQRHPDFKQWRLSIGPDYQHYHHWVLGVVKFNRGILETNEREKMSLVNSSVGEYSYVINQSSRTNPHLYILYYQRGMSLMVLGELGRAAEDLSTSIALNGDYRPAYEGLREVFARLGMQQQAEETLQLIREHFGEE